MWFARHFIYKLVQMHVIPPAISPFSGNLYMFLYFNFYPKIFLTKSSIYQSLDKLYYYVFPYDFITAQVDQVKRVTLAKLLCDNYNLQFVQRDVFRFVSPR